MKAINTRISELQYDEKEFILYIKIKNDVTIDLESIKEHFRATKELTNSENHFALIDACNYFSLEDEALKYAAMEEYTTGRIAAAFYSKNLASRLTIHFFKLFRRPDYLVELFKNKEDALDWLGHENKQDDQMLVAS
jgi:hypothetical protein